MKIYQSEGFEECRAVVPRQKYEEPQATVVIVGASDIVCTSGEFVEQIDYGDTYGYDFERWE